MPNGITELAKLFKERDNREGYSPIFGKITSLPDLQIKIGDKITIDETYIKSCFNLYETDIDGEYIHLGKDVILLPYSDMQKFIVVGAVI